LKTKIGVMAEFAFEKVYDGMRCDNLPISNTGSKGFSECKQRCLDNDLCEYMVFYPRSKIKLCELFENCDPVQIDEKVSIFKKVTPCNVAVDSYLQMISLQFPDIILRYQPPNQNLYCHCTLPFWMICVALVAEGSPESSILKSKLDPKTSLKSMAPFVRKSGMTIFSIAPPANAPRIYAEIQIWPLTRCLRRERCNIRSRRCPAMDTQFRAGDIVFVLKEDDPKALRDLPVKCISVPGISKLSTSPSAEKNAGFRDPHGRYPDLFFTELNYTPYLIFDEADFLGSSCTPPELRLPPVPPFGGSSSPGSSSQPEGQSPVPQASETLSKGQKKKLKKKLSSSSPATSEAGSSAQHGALPRDSFSGSEGFSPGSPPIPGVNIAVRSGSRIGSRQFYTQSPQPGPSSGSPPALIQPPLQRSHSEPVIDASTLEARETLSSDLSDLDDIDASGLEARETLSSDYSDLDDIDASALETRETLSSDLPDIEGIDQIKVSKSNYSSFLHSKILLFLTFIIFTSLAFLHKHSSTSNSDLYIEFIA